MTFKVSGKTEEDPPQQPNPTMGVSVTKSEDFQIMTQGRVADAIHLSIISLGNILRNAKLMVKYILLSKDPIFKD